jgi:hypothetical protein
VYEWHKFAILPGVLFGRESTQPHHSHISLFRLTTTFRVYPPFAKLEWKLELYAGVFFPTLRFSLSSTIDSLGNTLHDQLELEEKHLFYLEHPLLTNLYPFSSEQVAPA